MKGLHMRYLEYREQRAHGSEVFPVAFYHISPSHPRYNMPYHWHQEFELIRVLEGSLELKLDGRTMLARAGDILLIGDGVLHGGTPEHCVYECTVFDLGALVRANTAPGMELRGLLAHREAADPLLPRDERLSMPVRALFEALAQDAPGSALTVQGLICQFFGALKAGGFLRPAQGNAAQGRARLAQLKEALGLIEQEYSRELTLEDMARAAGMSPKYFCRFFREMTQKTPVEYLNYYRVECAAEQLLLTREPVTAVALRCGFNDLSYFIRVFKRYKGVTPKAYLRTPLT